MDSMEDGMNDVRKMLERCLANPQIIMNDDRTMVGNYPLTIHGLYGTMLGMMLE